jgi:DNA replication and repair protein RecF
MSYLEQIKLIQFKNHTSSTFHFASQINGIVGKNGVGKTNLLDAIHYICFARSYFTKTDKILQNYDTQGFRIDGTFNIKEETLQATCIYREDGKKELFLNEESIKKTSEYIGKVNIVFIAPDDIAIINEGTEVRRKFLDIIFCQIDKAYLQNLQQYNKVILQRNALLKVMNETGKKDLALLDIYNQQLIENANYIYVFRKEKLIILKELLIKKYTFLADALDHIFVHYESQMNNSSLHDLLTYNLQKDIFSQRTNYGIHKDDIVFMMHNEALKNMASQGQKKTFLLALKIAEYLLIQQETNTTPILLLDDIFERLDDDRMDKLFALITQQLQCQVFITDTNEERLTKHLQKFTTDFKIIHL